MRINKEQNQSLRKILRQIDYSNVLKETAKNLSRKSNTILYTVTFLTCSTTQYFIKENGSYKIVQNGGIS